MQRTQSIQSKVSVYSCPACGRNCNFATIVTWLNYFPERHRMRPSGRHMAEVCSYALWFTYNLQTVDGDVCVLQRSDCTVMTWVPKTNDWYLPCNINSHHLSCTSSAVWLMLLHPAFAFAALVCSWNGRDRRQLWSLLQKAANRANFPLQPAVRFDYCVVTSLKRLLNDSVVSDNAGHLEDGGELSRLLRVWQKSIFVVLASNYACLRINAMDSQTGINAVPSPLSEHCRVVRWAPPCPLLVAAPFLFLQTHFASKTIYPFWFSRPLLLFPVAYPCTRVYQLGWKHQCSCSFPARRCL